MFKPLDKWALGQVWCFIHLISINPWETVVCLFPLNWNTPSRREIAAHETPNVDRKPYVWESRNWDYSQKPLISFIGKEILGKETLTNQDAKESLSGLSACKLCRELQYFSFLILYIFIWLILRYLFLISNSSLIFLKNFNKNTLAQKKNLIGSPSCTHWSVVSSLSGMYRYIW